MVRGSKSSRKKVSKEKVVKVPNFVRKSIGCKYRDVEYSIDDKRILVLAGTEVRGIDAKTENSLPLYKVTNLVLRLWHCRGRIIFKSLRVLRMEP